MRRFPAVCLLGLLLVLAVGLAGCGSSGAPAPTETVFFEPTPTAAEASPFVEPTLPPFPTPAPAPASYEGVPLPAPAPVQTEGRTLPLPPAWLVIGQSATPGAVGSYTFSMDMGGGQAMSFHADSVQPELRGDVPQLVLAPDAQPVLLIAGPKPAELQVLRRAWSESPTALYADTEQVPTEALEEAEGLTALRLHVGALEHSQLLLVSARFPTGDSVDYFWRLEP